MKIELTIKQAAVLKTLLKNDIREMLFVVEHERLRPEDEEDAANIYSDIADNEEILRLLEEAGHAAP